MKQNDKILVDVLVKKSLVSKEDLTKFSLEAQANNESLQNVLLKRGLMTQEQILSLISSEFQLETINLKNLVIDKTIIDKVPVKFTSYYRFMPVKIVGK